jgi:hypothetical protein
MEGDETPFLSAFLQVLQGQEFSGTLNFVCIQYTPTIVAGKL